MNSNRNMNQNSNIESTATINSNNKNSNLSSHYREETTAMMMMNDDNMNRESAPLSDVPSASGVDNDLQGIPSFILDLQQTQPTLNIMTCGDVSHGKSTLLAALSGEKTGKHSAEKKGNMTIKLGYTSCRIWKCLLCPRPQCYFATHSDVTLNKVRCLHCGSKPNKSHSQYATTDSNVILVRHLSFVDVPGHAQLMQTMVSATSVADACILVIDASKSCPGKQTAQHLDAVNLLGLLKQGQMVIAQNKIDLIDASKACLHYQEIRNYLATFGDRQFAFTTPVIPISAQSKLNIDALCDSIIHKLPKFSSSLVNEEKHGLYMHVIRSFDVNKSSDLSSIEDIDKIKGGVLGGAVLSGHIRVEQEIEIRPGYIIKREGKTLKSALKTKLQSLWSAQPIRTTVKSLQHGRHRSFLGFAGGNVGIQTNIDPSLMKGDGMCGHVVIDANHPNPPPIFNKFIMSYTFLSDAIGRKSPFKKLEEVRVNIGAFKMKAEVVPRAAAECKEDGFQGVLVILEAPICAKVGDKVGICRQNKKKEWAFVGGGIIRRTKNIFIESDQEKLKQRECSATVLVEPQSSKQQMEMPVVKAQIVQNGKVDVGTNSIEVVNDVQDAVHVAYQQRSGRKGITTVVGLPQQCNFKKLTKKMKKEWNTGATLVEDHEKGTVIQLQGDRRSEVVTFITKLNLVKKSQITVHGY